MKTHWLMKGSASDDMDWGRYGILTFDTKWVRKLWQMANAFKVAQKKIPSLAELVVWDYTVSFYDKMPTLTKKQEARLDTYDYIELPAHEATLADNDHLTRTECEMLHLIDNGHYIYWRVIVKHTDVCIETPRIALKDFDCDVHGRDPRKKRTCLKCISKP